MVLLKLTLPPMLIGLISMAERKWGASISGLLVGLPLTAGPLLFFLALEQGRSFSAKTSIASMMGLVALSAFAAVYARVSQSRGWRPSLLAGTVAFLIASALLLKLPSVSVGWAFLMGCGALSLALCCFPHEPALMPVFKISGPREISLRMAAAAVIVFLLTSLASLLGPVSCGLASLFPVYTSILAVFNHTKSAVLARAVLKGVVAGAFGGAAFFVIVASAQNLGTGLCFGFATLAAVAVPALLFSCLSSRLKQTSF